MSNDLSRKIAATASLLHANDLQEIASPLKSLGITYFSHVNIDTEKRFSAVGSSPEFAKLYLEKKYYNLDIHMADTHIAEQFVLWDTLPVLHEAKKMDKDYSDLGFGHTFSIIREHEAGKDCYHFGAKLGNDAVNAFYLSNIDLLKRFINHFNDSVKSHKGIRENYNIKFQVDDDVHSKNLFIANNIDKFLAEVNCDRLFINKDLYLTKRELECLYWLAQGKSLDEISIILTISYSAIKAHIKNIKYKFSCANQFQLGMLYQKFQLIIEK